MKYLISTSSARVTGSELRPACICNLDFLLAQSIANNRHRMDVFHFPCNIGCMDEQAPMKGRRKGFLRDATFYDDQILYIDRLVL